MDCSDAGEYMMKYMDGLLTEQETSELHTHLKNCLACREDFAIYDGMMSDFSALEIVHAPEGFEDAVMARVATLPPHTAKAEKIDVMAYAVWGLYAVFLGAGFLLVLNQEAVVSYLAGVSFLERYAELMRPVTAYVSRLTAGFAAASESLAMQSDTWIQSFRYGVMFLFTALMFIQIFIHNRDQAQAQADAKK